MVAQAYRNSPYYAANHSDKKRTKEFPFCFYFCVNNDLDAFLAKIITKSCSNNAKKI